MKIGVFLHTSLRFLAFSWKSDLTIPCPHSLSVTGLEPAEEPLLYRGFEFLTPPQSSPRTVVYPRAISLMAISGFVPEFLSWQSLSMGMLSRAAKHSSGNLPMTLICLDHGANLANYCQRICVDKENEPF